MSQGRHWVTADDKKLVRFGLYIIGLIIFLVLGFYRETESEANLSEYFDNKLFDLDGVTTKLVNFSNSNDIISIKFDATGLPQNAVSYKRQILAYLCSEPFMKKQLMNGKVINFDMSALDRHEGRFVNIRVDYERCTIGS